MFAWMLYILISMPAMAEVVAMDSKTAQPVESEKIITLNNNGQVIVDKKNIRYEFSPYSVFEFSADGTMKLLRGSVIAFSSSEKKLKTSSADIDFIGRTILSYDHKEKSTSAFVLMGQARVLNPHENEKTVLLDKFQGASMIVGSVFPQLIRQLDFSSVNDWLDGYGWSKDRRVELLKDLPQTTVVENKVPEHLETTKLDDYFAAVEDASDDRAQPDYYEKKFGDQDKVVMEANEKKTVKYVSPEQAALIALPSNKIDLEMDLPPEFISQLEKIKELRADNPTKGKGRSIASISQPSKKANTQRKPEVSPASNEDPEVSAVLERLKRVREKGSVVSSKAEQPSRSPASLSTPVVPDPVYDFSQNF